MTLWTPSGERPVEREGTAAPPPSGTAVPPPASSGPGPGDAPLGDELTEEELQQRMALVQQELLSVPAGVVVANHCIGLFQLAALHLDQRPPNLSEAQLAIDAMAAMVDTLGPRLGEDEQPLRDTLASIRMGFVQVKAAVESGGQST